MPFYSILNDLLKAQTEIPDYNLSLYKVRPWMYWSESIFYQERYDGIFILPPWSGPNKTLWPLWGDSIKHIKLHGNSLSLNSLFCSENINHNKND